MKLIFCRHGETEANRLGCLQGHIDTPLTERGINQAYFLREFAKRQNVSNIFSSPLNRAFRTAKIISEGIGIPVRTDERLKEVCYGFWEGKLKSGLKNLDMWQSRKSNPFSFVHPGSFEGNPGESYEMLVSRLEKFIDSLDCGKVTIIVGHLGILRSAKYIFEKVSKDSVGRFSPSNSCVYVVEKIKNNYLCELIDLENTPF